jgi:hypothetical protein
MGERRIFVLDSFGKRDAMQAIHRAPEAWVCEVRPPKRNSDQNRKFHAICRDLAESHVEWSGRRRTEEEWKFLLVSGHAVATGRPGEFMLGLEQERMMLRPSTAAMSVAEMTSLIEYAIAFCAGHSVQPREAA